MENYNSSDIKVARKTFSTVGWALCAILGAMLATQILLNVVLQTFWPDGCWLTESPYGKWIVNFVPQYLIAIPLGLLLLRRIPAKPPKPYKIGVRNFWIFLPICFFLTYSGNIVGNLLSYLLSGGEAQNALDNFALDPNPIKILFMVVLAPLIEEYVFRKQILDRTSVYGEKASVFLSALTFGLFHANLFQFFYAFLLGWLFAYIYIRTGKLRYPVMMHAIINFMGGVIAPLVLSVLDMDALTDIENGVASDEVIAQTLPGMLLYFLYLIVILGLFVTGLVLLILQCKKLIWQNAEAQLTLHQSCKATYLNAGMLAFLAICSTLTVLSVML